MRNAMKSAVAGVTLAVMALGQVTSAMAAEGYTVVNRNDSVAIQRVWVTPASEDNWAEADMHWAIAPGYQAFFDFPSTGGNCFYDVKVRFSDGAEQTFDNVDVCRGTRLIAT